MVEHTWLFYFIDFLSCDLVQPCKQLNRFCITMCSIHIEEYLLSHQHV